MILRYRFIILIVLIAATIPFGLSLPSLTRDAGVSALVPETHPAYQFSSDMEELFGATDQIVVGVTFPEGIYTREGLALIHELTQFFEGLDDLDEEDVLSLTNIDDMQGHDGELVIERLFDEDRLEELGNPAILEIKNRVRANPLLQGKLVSGDERSAVVLAGVPTGIGLKEESIGALKEKTLAKLNDLRERFPQATLDFSGPAMLKAFISEYMQQDLKTLFPLAILVVAAIIILVLRSFMGMLIPVFVTLFAVGWTFGLKALLGSPITIVETAIPVVLIAIGCADGIHIISEFLGFRRQGASVHSSIQKTMNVLSLPVILTSVTTGLGFLSLLSAPGVSIKNMGVYLAFGVMVAMIFSLFFIPAFLSFFKWKRNQPTQAESLPEEATDFHKPNKPFEATTAKIGSWIVDHKYGIALTGFLLFLLSIVGVWNIEVESDEVRYLKKGNVFRLATENIQKHLGGITSVDIIIQSEEKDLLKRPEILKAMEALQRFCEEDDLVSYSLSLVDLLKRINFVLHDNNPEFDRLPNELEQVTRTHTELKNGQEIRSTRTETISGQVQNAQYLFLYEMSGGDSLEQYVDSEYKTGRISVRLNDMSGQRLENLLEKLAPFVKEHFPANVKINYANHYIRVVMMNLIIDSQIYSLLTVLATITILMSIMFRSIRIGLFTALPVFIAVLFNFAIMWFFDVTLNIGTSIVASVGMGVGIDYAIHYFTRFRLYLQQQMIYEVAIIKAISETSRAILTNATAVGTGFLVLLFSEYGVIANAGWITALSMLTTAFGSLIILPALLTIFKPKVL